MSAAQEASEEAELNTVEALNTKRAETILNELQKSSGDLIEILKLAITKLEGDERKLKEVMGDENMLKEKKLSGITLTYEKQFQPRYEIIQHRNEAVKSILKRRKAVPEKTEDPTLDKLREVTLEQARTLFGVYKQTMQDAQKIDLMYSTAIQELKA